MYVSRAWGGSFSCREVLGKAVGGVNGRKQVETVGVALCRLDDMGRLGDKLSWAPQIWDRWAVRKGLL